ncbi:imidazolonepropionase [Hahella sp. CCB-MM4]|uniref:imidazolonepropionase n=1 Tax=Hahella sp. (strain CCB-MM4) TaxID=1926491 RepID=UPI000B9ABD0D|nr:imidazolonepropionase [Hahella sp. CCB-MM4]OZG71361.1 imidazolonepropionase [Hahella sp. CCB-MM4]
MQWWINAKVASCQPHPLDDEAHGSYAIGVAKGHIQQIIPMSSWKAGRAQQTTGAVFDVKGRLVTPGLIDCHTHLVYAGHRAEEFEQRLNGVSYAEIARQGGGILSTVRATRAASFEELMENSTNRLMALMSEGVTTVEIKSGYGLNLESELKMLRVARALGEKFPVRIKTTLLAAHALPEEYKGRSDEYIDWVCREAIPAAAKENLADAVDVFCESIAFTTEQCRKVFETAAQYDLPVKGHMEQLTLSGGSKLAAAFHALSVDHVEYLDEVGVASIAESGTVATLLPGAFYFLREHQLPPIDLLRSYQVPMALASDLNPGSSPLASLRLMMNMGSTLFGLTPQENLAGVTRNAAKALGEQSSLGQLQEGYVADFVVWDLQHPAQLSYQFGTQDVYQRVFKGVVSNDF